MIKHFLLFCALVIQIIWNCQLSVRKFTHTNLNDKILFFLSNLFFHIESTPVTHQTPV